MSFWQQLHQVLSEEPGNAVYHLVTLFAIQATLALAISQWRRERSDGQRESRMTRRLALAAGGMLLARVGLLLVSLIVAAWSDRVLAVGLLPPLEQAVNTVTALLLVWALVPPLASLPRLLDVVVVLLLFLIGIVYAFFAQDWAATAEAGLTYNSSLQSTVWGIFQLSILGLGAIVLLLSRPSGWLLSLATVSVLLGAHFVNFWELPEIIPRNTEIPVWIRLGHLVALPLLAIIAYRHTLSRLLSLRQEEAPPGQQLAESFQLATRVIDAPELEGAMAAATNLVAKIVAVPFVGLAVGQGDWPERLRVSTLVREPLRQQRAPARPHAWALNLSDWPAFRLAMEQAKPIELLPDGIGARQLHDLAQEMGVQHPGPLLILPLQATGVSLGVLLLGGAPGQEAWPSGLHGISSSLADYVAHALANSQDPESEGQVQVLQPTATVSPEPVTGQLITLEEERDRAQARAETLADRLQQTEMRLNEAQQRSRDLAATVEVLEQARPGEERAALQAEIEALRESLIEAEEAMAMAAAGEGKLSTEWVMMAISRYSAELEEAQAEIARLEEALVQRDPSKVGQLLTALAQELRTPLTSIGGYTDLLLGETMGILGSKQRQFLKRIKSNVERLGLLLEQIVQVAAADSEPVRLANVESVSLPDVLETAVDTVITHMRRRELRLNLAIAEGIPRLNGNRDALCQVVIHLLHNAFLASDHQGNVMVTAHTDTVLAQTPAGEHQTERFVHLSVQDSGGGIRPEDRAHVFDPQYRAEHPPISGLGDTGAGLSVAQTLVGAHGGRMWVDSEMGVGSTFTVLLPVRQNGGGPPDSPGVEDTTESAR